MCSASALGPCLDGARPLRQCTRRPNIRSLSQVWEITVQTEFDINLQRDDIYACGRVAVWGSMLDTMMEVAIWTLLDLPKPETRKLTHGMGAKQKQQWLDILCASRHLTPTEKSDLRDILKSLPTALEERNLVIHGLWHIGPDNEPWAVKYTKDGKRSFHDRLNAELVQPIADDIKVLARRLAQWITKRDPLALSGTFPKILNSTKPVRGVRSHRSRRTMSSTKPSKR